MELGEEYADCDRCTNLCASRKRVVFGSGSSSAPIMVVGEAPGNTEDEEGVTFVGEGGQLLMSMLATAWPKDDRMAEIKRIQEDGPYFEELREYLDDYIFWTNAALCHPPENRNPTSQELKNCASRLHRAIYAVDPLLIIAAGKIPASLLMGKSVQITDRHGDIFDIKIPSPVTGDPVRYPMLAILHPAFLLRQGDQPLVKKKKGTTYETIEDLRRGLEVLQRLHIQAYGHSFLER